MRSSKWPDGFPWLEGSQREKCAQANVFIERSVQALEAADMADAYTLMEHPEDLGTLHNGGNPCAIWSRDDVMQMAKSTKAVTAAIHQCAFGKDSPKPTRLLGTLPGLRGLPHRGWPRKDRQGFYLGPLPRDCGHRHKAKLIGRNEHGHFRTHGSAAYPGPMCKALAAMMHAALVEGAAAGKWLKVGKEDSTEPASPISVADSKEEEEKEPEAKSPKEEERDQEDPPPDTSRVGVGPPLQARWGGRWRQMHDGAGLCSPGRWEPGKKGSQTPGQAYRCSGKDGRNSWRGKSRT